MSWVREIVWFAAVGLAITLAIFLLPGSKRRGGVDELTQSAEQVRSEFAAQRAQRAERLAKVQTDGTLETLRSIGRVYRNHLARTKTPPTADDFRELIGMWRGRRDDQPPVIQWGVDLARVPTPTGTALAWERTPGADGQRCVLLADAETAKLIPEPEFEKLPRAK
ncbi:unnamed protein product [Gemmata massiliana]|uniref:Uncharacterized protein n=1 Tax=Gemmata massiliana TaxID=1210884 RepID=A0A6P2CW34_9BACT|nr:hypothetical protein [Gemmata massiliana]VTR93191.1 unnamed protein product [Gemmata massiliana]